MSQVQINDADIGLFSGTSWDWRSGTEGQSVIPGFELATNVSGDGRELPHNGDSSGTNSITYTTRGTDITRVTLIFSIPFLFNLQESTGRHTNAWIDIKVEYREFGSGGGFTNAPGSPFQWQDKRDSLSFRTFDVSFEHADQWELRLFAFDHSGGGQNQNDQDPSLYNVHEFSRADTSNYPHSALLAVFGVASAQITSFESMRTSALVKGRKVLVWDGATDTLEWTNKRTWIVRDLLTDARVGLGHRLHSGLIDKDAMLEAQSYYDETVDGEARDYLHPDRAPPGR
jgi:predicted phage tail protein